MRQLLSLLALAVTAKLVVDIEVSMTESFRGVSCGVDRGRQHPCPSPLLVVD